MTVGVVTGGTVVDPGGRREEDVVIDGAFIAASGKTPELGETIDATGCFVLPGGVDPHCHLMAAVGPATRAAVLGGTTTVLSFTNPEATESDLECYRRRKEEIEAGGAFADVGLHAMLYDPEHASPEDLAAFRQAGAAAFKVFLAYQELGIMCSSGRLLELMASAARIDMIAQVHCEHGGLIDALVRQGLSERRYGPRLFAETRPPEVEEEAVVRAISAASLTGATCYLVHLSCGYAMEQVRVARARGHPRVVAEVCLHHLVLDDGEYDGPDAGRYLVAPPLRSRRDVEALWEAVADGTVDTLGSDHCQARSPVPQEVSGPGESSYFGLAGVGARLPVLLSEGLDRSVPINRLVEVASTNPARVFGLYPRKGSLAPGSDADIVVWDPTAETVVTDSTFDDGTGDSVYRGRRVRGGVRDVIMRGQLIVRDGRLVGPDPSGRFVSPGTAGPDRLVSGKNR